MIFCGTEVGMVKKDYFYIAWRSTGNNIVARWIDLSEVCNTISFGKKGNLIERENSKILKIYMKKYRT